MCWVSGLAGFILLAAVADPADQFLHILSFCPGSLDVIARRAAAVLRSEINLSRLVARPPTPGIRLNIRTHRDVQIAATDVRIKPPAAAFLR